MEFFCENMEHLRKPGPWNTLGGNVGALRITYTILGAPYYIYIFIV